MVHRIRASSPGGRKAEARDVGPSPVTMGGLAALGPVGAGGDLEVPGFPEPVEGGG